VLEDDDVDDGDDIVDVDEIVVDDDDNDDAAVVGGVISGFPLKIFHRFCEFTTSLWTLLLSGLSK